MYLLDKEILNLYVQILGYLTPVIILTLKIILTFREHKK